MRIGVVWDQTANANYRAIEPALQMARRGHAVVWPTAADGRSELWRLTGCDVVHVYRRADPMTRKMLTELAAQGSAIVYDNDDDYTSVPKGSPAYHAYGGVNGQRAFAELLKIARIAHTVTTTSEPLAASYRKAGVARVEVIPNAVSQSFSNARLAPDGVLLAWDPPPPAALPERLPGLVIGWIAGAEHSFDVSRVPIVPALRQLMAERPEVHVETIGVRLALEERYRHHQHIFFPELPAHMARWDIGIAPLADIPWNRARSDIKLKEYAAVSIPWLASPVGPYAAFGEAEGGRLVPDDGWYEAFDALARDPDVRASLAARGRAWAQNHTLDQTADAWERVFAEAAGPRAAQPATPPPARPGGPTRFRVTLPPRPR